MRIGIITHNYPARSDERKDAGIFLYDFAQELSHTHKVFVLAPNFIGKKEKYSKVPVTWFNWAGGNKKLGDLGLLNPKAAYELFSLNVNGCRSTSKFVQDNKIDFIIAAWAFPSGLFALWGHLRTSVPYAVWSLGSDINKYAKTPLIKTVIFLTLKYAKVRFANSFVLCTEVFRLTKLKCTFLPAITDLKGKVSARDRNKIFTFLYVGRLEKVKGVDILIDAASKLSLNYEWQIHIGGDGNLEKELKGRVGQIGLSKRIKFLGRLNSSEVISEMSRADFLIVPSRSESLPLVIIEASRAGLPVITADVGDCKRLIKKYKIGYCFAKEDRAALTSLMKRVISNKKRKSIYLEGLRKLADDFKQHKAVEILNKNLII